MHFSGLLISSLLWATNVDAGPLSKRQIAPFPDDVPDVTDSLDAETHAAAYNEALALSESESSGNVTAETIRLINFNGCDNMPGVTNAYAQIYSGWQQSQRIMGLRALIDGAVDFNTAGALEYLGAPGLNTARQGDMNRIFSNFATLTPALWPFGYRVHVRCDDPSNRCTCGPNGGGVTAYTTNVDLDSGLARINFCPYYFDLPTLGQAIAQGRTLPSEQRYDMNRYSQTQGHVFTHEFMHIDWVTYANGAGGNYGHNEHVRDLNINFRDSRGGYRQTGAWGPRACKILARWPTDTGDYTIRNADNLALFMTSQYVQSQLEDTYPHLPVVTVEQPDRPPYAGPRGLFILNNDETILLNDTHPLADEIFAEDSDCSVDEDVPEPEVLEFSSFAPDNAFPSDYIATHSSWVASEAPDAPSITDAPSEPFCIPFQDPGWGIDGYCQCTGGEYYSFAEDGGNPCPYTSPGPASMTLDPETITGTGGNAGTPGTEPPPAPTTEPTEPPANAPIGDPCTPGDPQWGCTEDLTEVVYCYCGEGDECVWTSFGQCEGGVATCHLQGEDGNCGPAFGACC